MVTQPTKDGKRKWTWFGVVLEVSRRNLWLTCYRLGDWERMMTVHIRDEKITVVLIPEDKWPDGVWALRTKAILEGKIDVD